MPAVSVPIASAVVEVCLVEDYVPTVAAVATAVGDGHAGLPAFVGLVREAMSDAAAIDARDRLGHAHSHEASVGSVRVVAGLARGRRLSAPPGNSVRPTTDRVREAVFNALSSLDLLDGAVVLDLFAGTGALGIEALSRGAERAIFVDNDRKALDFLRDNLATCGFTDRATIVERDALAALPGLEADLVLADPPYRFDAWPALLGSVSAPWVVVESDRPLDDFATWESVRCRSYGSTVVTFLHRDPTV